MSVSFQDAPKILLLFSGFLTVSVYNTKVLFLVNIEKGDFMATLQAPRGLRGYEGPREVKEWIMGNADKNTIYPSTNSTGDDYTIDYSQCGGSVGVAYQNLQGLLHVKDSAGAWKQVKDVWVNDNGTWKRVKASYHNINGTWTPTYTG